MINTVKRKSVKTDTAIKVIAIGILGYIGLKTIPSLASGLGGATGGSGGYMGSGTDLSSIPAGFFTETPPVFNITNTPPDSFFINPDTVIDTNKIINSGNIPKETNETKKEFTVKRVPEKIVGNTSSSLLTNLFNPNYWVGSWGKELPSDEYTLRQQNNARFAIFKTPTDFINAGVNPLGFLINIFKSTSGSGGGGGGCRSGNCPTTNDTPFTIDLTTKKTAIINSGNTGVTAQSFLTSLRNEGIAPRTITYTPNIMTPMEYGDYFNKKLAVIEQNAQNKLATSLASGNCGPAISTNACSGITRTTNYSNIVSNTANQSTRYYENTGTSLTRSDLTLSP